MNITIQRLKINIVENFSWFRSKSRSIQKKKNHLSNDTILE